MNFIQGMAIDSSFKHARLARLADDYWRIAFAQISRKDIPAKEPFVKRVADWYRVARWCEFGVIPAAVAALRVGGLFGFSFPNEDYMRLQFSTQADEGMTEYSQVAAGVVSRSPT